MRKAEKSYTKIEMLVCRFCHHQASIFYFPGKLKKGVFPGGMIPPVGLPHICVMREWFQMEYRKVYFRIDSSYRYDTGWPGKDAEDAFLAESRALFQGAGWELHPGRPGSGACDTVTKGLQELYLHPMEFSGVIREDEIPAVREALSTAESFRCRGVDCYEEYTELSDEEYLAQLGSRRDEIEAEILKHYQTRRRNLYITGPGAANIARKFSVRRVNDRDGKHDLARQFVENLIQQMLREGRLVSAETRYGAGIRAATPEELNTRGLDHSGPQQTML